MSGRPSRTAGFLAGGQHPVDAEPDQGLERCEGVARHVEGAVEGHRQRPCRGDEPGRALGIDVALGVEKPDHHAIGTFGLGGGDIGQHDRIFVIVEQEVAAARPDDHLKADAGYFSRRADEAEARRGAAFEKIGAELDALRARILGGAHAGDRIHADFVDHRKPPHGLGAH